MLYTQEEVLQYIEENDVRFIRLAFCDAFGELKNISVMDQDMAEAFSSGISFNPSEVEGFPDCDGEDLLLYPIPHTLTLLPWRPQRGRVVRMFCEIKHIDGTPYAGDVRRVLKTAEEKLLSLGLDCIIGTDCEFYLFETDEAGTPTNRPQDFAGRYDIAPRDKGENVRREICLTINEMGIQPRRSHHERGPGQNEIDFQYTSPTKAADHFITFKTTVKTIAAKNGLFASFCPKPLEEYDGNGLHVNIILFKDGENIFAADSRYAALAEAFTEGLLRHLNEISVFFNSTVNSYKRLSAEGFPTEIIWSRKNSGSLVAIPKNSHNARLRLRSPDSACNPYLAFSLMLLAGAEGIEQKLTLREPEIPQKDAENLPASLGEACRLARESRLANSALPSELFAHYISAKEREARAYKNAADKGRFERENYFFVI